MTEAKKIEARTVLPSQVKFEEHAHNIWCVIPEYGTTVEDMKREEYWAAVARQMRHMDEIKVMAEDSSWWAHFIVRNVGHGSVNVGLVNFKEFGDKVAESYDFDAYRATWKGPVRKWIVERRSDDQVMKEGFGDKGEALTWIGVHAKSLAA